MVTLHERNEAGQHRRTPDITNTSNRICTRSVVTVHEDDAPFVDIGRVEGDTRKRKDIAQYGSVVSAMCGCAMRMRTVGEVM